MISERAMVVLAGLAAAVWVIGPVVVVKLPEKQRDPQRGQAVGCLMLVSVAGLGLAGLLALGVWMGWGWMVRPVEWVLVFPFGLAAVNAVAYPFVRWRKRAMARRWEEERAERGE